MSDKSPTMKALPADPEVGESVSPAPRKRGISCLQTKRSKYICGISTALAALTIGLLAFFLWPRYPTLYIALRNDKPFLQDLKITGGPLTASPTNPFLLTMSISNLVTAYSNAYIGITAREVMVEVKLLDDAGNEVPSIIGTSEVADVTFPKKTNTTMDSTVKMEYKVTSPTNIVSDPVLPLLAGKCLSSDNSTSPPGQLRARVYVKLDLDGLSWMGVYPSFSQEVQSPCSMSGSEVLKGLTGGGNNLLGSLLSGLPN